MTLLLSVPEFDSILDPPQLHVRRLTLDPADLDEDSSVRLSSFARITLDTTVSKTD